MRDSVWRVPKHLIKQENLVLVTQGEKTSPGEVAPQGGLTGSSGGTEDGIIYVRFEIAHTKEEAIHFLTHPWGKVFTKRRKKLEDEIGFFINKIPRLSEKERMSGNYFIFQKDKTINPTKKTVVNRLNLPLKIVLKILKH